MLKLSEIYTSIQGEGPGVGQPTQFVRFAGCNLRCPGWPCDTQHAIDPKLYRSEWRSVEVEYLLQSVESWPKSVTLTGGEPLLQPMNELAVFANGLLQEGWSIDMFTNGTFELPTWAAHYRVRVIMDWKLSGSGEDPENETRISNLLRLGRNDAIKFVVSNREDFDASLEMWEKYVNTRFDTYYSPHLYMGAAWGKLDEKQLVEWMLDNKLTQWKLNVQMHNYIWPRDERGR
jgi:7-carboxy-7-deazaguanine synthase